MEFSELCTGIPGVSQCQNGAVSTLCWTALDAEITAAWGEVCGICSSRTPTGLKLGMWPHKLLSNTTSETINLLNQFSQVWHQLSIKRGSRTAPELGRNTMLLVNVSCKAAVPGGEAVQLCGCLLRWHWPAFLFFLHYYRSNHKVQLVLKALAHPSRCIMLSRAFYLDFFFLNKGCIFGII